MIYPIIKFQKCSYNSIFFLSLLYIYVYIYIYPHNLHIYIHTCLCIYYQYPLLKENKIPKNPHGQRSWAAPRSRSSFDLVPIAQRDLHHELESAQSATRGKRQGFPTKMGPKNDGLMHHWDH